jgi:hypothetical protein
MARVTLETTGVLNALAIGARASLSSFNTLTQASGSTLTPSDNSPAQFLVNAKSPVDQIKTHGLLKRVHISNLLTRMMMTEGIFFFGIDSDVHLCFFVLHFGGSSTSLLREKEIKKYINHTASKFLWIYFFFNLSEKNQRVNWRLECSRFLNREANSERWF